MLSKKYHRFVFAFLMAGFMALIMSLMMTYFAIGCIKDFFSIWIKSYLKGFAIAFPVVIIVGPKFHKLASIICCK